LQQVYDGNLKERLKEANARRKRLSIMRSSAFCLKMQAREIVPTFVELRDGLEETGRDEIERNRRHLKIFPLSS